AVELGNHEAIGLERGAGAVREPVVEISRIVEEAEHDRFVIALEKMRVESARQLVQRHIYDAPAVGPTVDIVSEKDERSSTCLRGTCSVRGDLGKQQSEQVGTSVNIADSVYELALRQGCMVHEMQTVCGRNVGRERSYFCGRPQGALIFRWLPSCPRSRDRA